MRDSRRQLKMPRNLGILVAGLLMTGPAGVVFSRADEVEDANRLAANVFEAFAANSAAIERFDVSFRTSEFVEFGDGGFLDRVADVVLKVDFAKNHYFYIRRLRDEMFPGSGQDESNPQRLLGIALIANGREVHTREFDRSIVNRKVSDAVRKHIGIAGVPELRMVGWTEFPAPTFEQQFYESLIASRTIPSPKLSGRQTSDGFLVVRRTPMQEFEREDSWVFNESFVPLTHRSRYVKRGENGRVIDKSQTFSEEYEWRDKGALRLISTIKGESIKPARDGIGKKRMTRVSYQTKFHWVSVNQLLDPADFEPNRLNDLSSIVQLLEKATRHF